MDKIFKNSNEKRPSFQFYPKDFLSDTDTMAMPNEAIGIYFKLLCYDWVNDGIHNNDKKIMRIVNFEWHDFNGNERDIEDYNIILSHIHSKFIAHPSKEGFLTNPRLQKEREKQKDFIQKKINAGKEGASKRWDKPKHTHIAKNSTPIVLPMAKNSSSSSSSIIKKNIYIKRKFTKPSLSEVVGYCKQRGNGIDAEKFIAHYESKGWMIGKTPMKDWKSAIITWEKNSEKKIDERDRKPGEAYEVWQLRLYKLENNIQ